MCVFLHSAALPCSRQQVRLTVTKCENLCKTGPRQAPPEAERFRGVIGSERAPLAQIGREAGRGPIPTPTKTPLAWGDRSISEVGINSFFNLELSL